jgi:hypothetical protein
LEPEQGESATRRILLSPSCSPLPQVSALPHWIRCLSNAIRCVSEVSLLARHWTCRNDLWFIARIVLERCRFHCRRLDACWSVGAAVVTISGYQRTQLSPRVPPVIKYFVGNELSCRCNLHLCGDLQNQLDYTVFTVLTAY